MFDKFHLKTLFIDVVVVLTLVTSASFTEENEIFKQKYPPHGLLTSLKHEELVLAQQTTLFKNIHLGETLNKMLVFVKFDKSISNIMRSYIPFYELLD